MPEYSHFQSLKNYRAMATVRKVGHILLEQLNHQGSVQFNLKFDKIILKPYKCTIVEDSGRKDVSEDSIADMMAG